MGAVGHVDPSHTFKFAPRENVTFGKLGWPGHATCIDGFYFTRKRIPFNVSIHAGTTAHLAPHFVLIDCMSKLTLKSNKILCHSYD